ncbi:hypothetical protein C7B69_13225 [filamentous cyanobacterium Phorm 46]|nr:hypothetical protein C7B69_13225 [filamentous cyanobacterium Phorm 46]
MRSQLRLSNSYLKFSISPGVGELSAAVKLSIDSKETRFLSGIKDFKGFDPVFSSIEPGFCVFSALLILGRSSHLSKPSRVNYSDS